MAQTYYQADADPNRIKRRRVAVIGYGSQGHAHALNLRDSGVDVRVGLRQTSAGRAQAEQAGLVVLDVDKAARWADAVVLLVPDPVQPKVYKQEIEPGLTAGNTLLFGHGFNIHYGSITPPKDIDVSLVAPKSPGHRVRETFLAGQGVPALVAVEQDASGQALADALSYAAAIGSTRAGVIATTFAEETETDLFGEQAVLCGGVSALIEAAFEMLVQRGYQPEVAYFECLHELKLIVDLIYRGGLNYMRYSVSDTAEYGDYVAGPRLINEEVRREMSNLLDQIQDGTFARAWIQEHQLGRAEFQRRRAVHRDHPIEAVGAALRRRMPFLNAVEMSGGEPAAAAQGGEAVESEYVPFF